MNLGKQKELAARALGVSKKRVKLNATDVDSTRRLKEMISREDARDLLSEGFIVKLNKKGNSRTRANKIMTQKKKGLRNGAGSRKGTANARFKSKDKWIIKIRALRTLLRKYKTEGRLAVSAYREFYLKAKGNFFRNKRHMTLYLEQNKILKEKEVVAGGKK